MTVESEAEGTELDHEAMQAEIDKALAGEAAKVAEELAPAASEGEAPATDVEQGAVAEGESVPAAEEEPFIGKWKKDEVVGLLERLEQFDPNGLRSGLERALSGHLGQMGQRVKVLEEGLAKE